MLVRLFTFRPTWPGDVTDQFLRQRLLPALVAQPGLLAVYAARGAAENGDQRIVASVWSADVAGDERADELAAPFDFEADEVVSGPAVELIRAEFGLDFDRPESPQILRIFRGQVVPGELDTYIEQARIGTLADTAAEHGPHALYLGRIPPDGFVTVSIWAAWETIAAATGGNIRQPIATKHSHLLVSGTASHYEIVPSTLAGHPAAGTLETNGDEPAESPRTDQLAVTEQP